MKTLLILLTLSASAAAQTTPPQVKMADLPPDTVVGTVNGKKITAGELLRIVEGVPPVAKKAFEQNPKQFLKEYSWYTYLQNYAVKNKYDQTTPYKEKLDFYRMLTLVEASLNEARKEVSVSADEQKQHYDANKDSYKEVKAKLIYIPFSATQVQGAKQLSEAEAKAKAELIAKQARGGANFVELVKKHSQDPGSVAQNGDLGVPVRKGTPQIPEPMKNAVLALNAGQVSDPLRHENGYYVFRAESAGVLPYDQVKEDIYRELKERGFAAWQEKTKSEASVTFEKEEYFQPSQAAPAVTPSPSK